MKNNRKKVEGHNTLYRTTKGSIVNSDKNAYDAYIRKRTSSKVKNETLKCLGEELQNAKNEIAELKLLINQIFINKDSTL